jgi:hypothetical protein
MKMQIKHVLMALIVSAILVSNQGAFASYYMGGHTEETPVGIKQVFGYTDFTGSAPGSMTDHALSLMSTAGWSTTTSDATGYMYQGILQLMNGNGNINMDSQVWYDNNGSPVWACFNQPGGCPEISTLSVTSYVYQTFYWNSGRTQVTFYYSPVFTNSSSTDNFQYYTPATYSDPTNDFHAGLSSLMTYNGFDWYAKFLQFGVEADSQTQNWNAKQYSMGYVSDSGSTVSLSNLSAFSVNGCSDTDSTCNGVPDTGSDISWTYSGSTKVPMGIGGSQYDVQVSIPSAGTITWSPVTSGQLGTDVQLW